MWTRMATNFDRGVRRLQNYLSYISGAMQEGKQEGQIQGAETGQWTPHTLGQLTVSTQYLQHKGRALKQAAQADLFLV